MNQNDKNQNDEPDESFLSRWSRRKQEARGEEALPAAAEPVSAPAEAAADAEKPGAAEPEIDVAKLPRIEDLNADSDFTAFLKKGVPAELKRLALRRAWALDPTIRDFIEVAENQYDWNAPDGVPGFGPLDPDTDIAALLRQAIGAPPSPAVAAAEAAGRSPLPATNTIVEDDGDAAPQETAAVAASTPATVDAADMALTVQAGPEHAGGGGAGSTAYAPTEPGIPDSGPGSEPITAARAIAAGRRRHGGALPG